MTKQELTRDIKATIGNFPNQSQIARYLNKRRDYVREMMAGAEGLEDGKSKKYPASVVADRIWQRLS